MFSSTQIASYPALARLAKSLEEASNALVLEYDSLRDASALVRQNECLHDATRGGWLQVPVVGDMAVRVSPLHGIPFAAIIHVQLGWAYNRDRGYFCPWASHCLVSFIPRHEKQRGVVSRLRYNGSRGTGVSKRVDT